MHLLLVCARWELIGGSERYALAIAHALAERGHELTLLIESGEPDPKLHCRTLRLAEVWRPEQGPRSHTNFVAAVRALRADAGFILTPTDTRIVELLCRTLPVVRFVQDHTLFCPGLNKMLKDGERCERPMGLACIEQYFLRGGCHGYQAQPDTNRLLKPFTRLEAKRRELAAAEGCARLLVASDYMRDELVRVGIARERISVLPYFTDAPLAKREPLPPATAAFVAAHERLILTPARLTLPDKGVDYLLTGLAQLETEFHAVIAGSGPAAEWLAQKARAEGLAERVHFSGWLSPGQMETLYAACTLVAFPSVWNEPFGLVGIEAMAHAKPVVAFAGGGVGTWLEDGVTGTLVPARATQAFAAALTTLLTEPDRARAYGAAGEARVRERHSRAAHVEQLEALFAQLSPAGAR